MRCSSTRVETEPVRGSVGSRAGAVVAALCLMVALSACETPPKAGGGEDQAGPRHVVDPVGRIGQAPLPTYAVGDQYVFDNPEETWTIRDVGDDTITWDSDLGGMRVTPRDPLMPSLLSGSPDVGTVTREVRQKAGSLWPLSIGNEASFLVSVSMEGRPAQSLAWNCRVVGTTRTEVPPGSFNTYKVACVRSDGLRLYTYHSPTVGYFVRREVTTSDEQQQTRSLLAVSNGRITARGIPDAPAPVAAPAAPAQSTPLPAPDGASATPDASTPVAPTAPLAATPAPAPAPQPVAQPATTAAAPGAWAGAGVRVGSFRTMEGARTGWANFQSAYPGLLGDLSPRIERVDLGDKGTYYRVYGGPFPSASAARDLCGQIPEMGSVCDVKTFN
ncbi:SPOR domain-containing protein [Rhodospira trueperi]|uniref:Sporulation related domain-containing protein n=1 Tax=Rhodospira trueperi TaxID=69960 RepID=A0A1G7E3S3_9PROT|nr:SPOR domain-containing protein [Rhodospira trueperi]SDE58311.1 Sporulation related domain-containing protein [Rhodospira trueperi]